jgi:hypothetical protein
MNKKKIFGFIAVMVIAAVAVWNVNLNSQKSDLSDVNLANIEALAGEDLSELLGFVWNVYYLPTPYCCALTKICEPAGNEYC